MRLYFTTTSEPYVLNHANSNPFEYWWAEYADENLSNGNYTPALAGTYTLTAPLDPSMWVNAFLQSGTDYTNQFYSAAGRVAQIGLSFGGCVFLDTGVGVFNPDDPWPWPTVTLNVVPLAGI